MRKTILASAAALTLLGSPAFAQGTTTTSDPAMGTTTTMQDDGDNDFPWGLLGLLGLAGLLGRKRNDHDTVRRNS